MVANVITEGLFKNNAWDFFTAGTALNPDTIWTGQGEPVISLKELITWKPGATINPQKVTASRMEVIKENVKGEWLNMFISSALIGVGGKMIRKVARKPIRMGNTALKQLGLGTVVRI